MQLAIPIVPTVFLVLAFSLVFLSNVIFYVILGEVNGKQGPKEQFRMFFLNFKVSRIIQLHREFYPDSKKRWLIMLTFVAGVVILIGVVAANIHIVAPDQLGTHHG